MFLSKDFLFSVLIDWKNLFTIPMVFVPTIYVEELFFPWCLIVKSGMLKRKVLCPLGLAFRFSEGIVCQEFQLC